MLVVNSCVDVGLQTYYWAFLCYWPFNGHKQARDHYEAMWWSI